MSERIRLFLTKLLFASMLMLAGSSSLFTACAAPPPAQRPDATQTGIAMDKTRKHVTPSTPTIGPTGTAPASTSRPTSTAPVGITPDRTAPAAPASTEPGETPQAYAATRIPWNNIQNWAYWLDNPDLQQLAPSNFQLLVIDYSADGSAKRAFTAAQINQLRQSGCQQRRVVSYLSIGQAESYRGYWQNAWRPGSPAWLGSADPHWDRNYWVHFWDPEWQHIIYHYLDSIIAAGFDGVYLDRVDAYQEDFAAGHEDDMVQFVMDIAHYARAHSPLGEDFGIIVQNAEDLATDHDAYVRTVTGIGREEVYVHATNKPASPGERSQAEQHLDLFRRNSRGQLVLTVDYATSANLVSSAYQQAQAKGYVPYVTTVGLNSLRVNPGYEPKCDARR